MKKTFKITQKNAGNPEHVIFMFCLTRSRLRLAIHVNAPQLILSNHTRLSWEGRGKPTTTDLKITSISLGTHRHQLDQIASEKQSAASPTQLRCGIRILLKLHSLLWRNRKKARIRKRDSMTKKFWTLLTIISFSRPTLDHWQFSILTSHWWRYQISAF